MGLLCNSLVMQRHTTSNKTNTYSDFNQGNDSIYTVDATKKLKEFIDDDEPSLIDFSIYESKPSDYTKRLRSIVQDNHDDGSVADESNNNNINFNSLSINVESNDKDTSSIIIMNDTKTNASTDDTTTNDNKANDTKPNNATTAIGVDTKLRQLFSDRSFAPRLVKLILMLFQYN